MITIIGNLHVDSEEKTAKIDGEAVSLQLREFETLQFLSLVFHLDPTQVVSKYDLLKHFYPKEDWKDDNLSHVYICKLRKKLLDAPGGKNYIETIWGKGFKLSAKLEDST